MLASDAQAPCSPPWSQHQSNMWRQSNMKWVKFFLPAGLDRSSNSVSETYLSITILAALFVSKWELFTCKSRGPRDGTFFPKHMHWSAGADPANTLESGSLCLPLTARWGFPPGHSLWLLFVCLFCFCCFPDLAHQQGALTSEHISVIPLSNCSVSGPLLPQN